MSPIARSWSAAPASSSRRIPLRRAALVVSVCAALLLALEGRGAGPPPAVPSALAVVPVVIGSVRGQSGNVFMAFSPDGRMLAANHGAPVDTDSFNTLLLWETASLRLRRREILPSEYRNDWGSLHFTPDGRRLADSFAGRPLLWDFVSRKVALRLPKEVGPGRGGTGLTVSPAGRTLVIGWGTHAALWDYEAPKRLATFGKPDFGWAMYSPDGKTLLTNMGGSAELWDVATLRRRAILKLSLRRHVFAFSPDSSVVATGGCSGDSDAVRLWDVRTGKLRDTWRVDDSFLHYISFSPCGRLLAAGFDLTHIPWQLQPGRVRFWDTAARRECGTFDIKEGLEQIAFSPAEPVLAVSLPRKPEVRFYRILPSPPPGPAAPAPPFVPDAKLVLPPQAAGWWADLAGEDAEKAYDAVLALGSRPAVAVSLLGRHLKPVAASDRRRIETLVRDLSSDQFAVRERAAKELAPLGELGEPALRKAAAGPDAEARNRARRLLAPLDRPMREGDRIRAVRSAEVLEMAGTDDARRLLAWLATGAPEATLTREAAASLGRLQRRKALAARP